MHQMAVSVYRNRAERIGHVVRNNVLELTIFFRQMFRISRLAQLSRIGSQE